MSEWYDSQRKTSGDFHKLLQEQIEIANPRRTELTREEQTRLAKLDAIAAKLKRGENLQNRQLQTWLREGKSYSIGCTDFPPCRYAAAMADNFCHSLLKRVGIKTIKAAPVDLSDAMSAA